MNQKQKRQKLVSVNEKHNENHDWNNNYFVKKYCTECGEKQD